MRSNIDKKTTAQSYFSWIAYCLLACLAFLFGGCNSSANIYREAMLLDNGQLQQMVGTPAGAYDILLTTGWNPQNVKKLEAADLKIFEYAGKAVTQELRSMGFNIKERRSAYLGFVQNVAITQDWVLVLFNIGEIENKSPSKCIASVVPDFDGALRTVYLVCNLMVEGRDKEAEAFFAHSDQQDIRDECYKGCGETCIWNLDWNNLTPEQKEIKADFCSIHRPDLNEAKKHINNSDHSEIFPEVFLEHVNSLEIPPQLYISTKVNILAGGHVWQMRKTKGRWVIDGVYVFPCCDHESE